jgi:hypothetical protein
MTSVEIKDGEVVLYSSIKELPIARSKEFAKYLLQDAGIGDSMADVDSHLERLLAYASKGDTEAVATEAHNLRLNLFTMLDGWNFQSLAFGCLIYSIDGQPFTEITGDALRRTIDKLSERGLTNAKVVDIVDEIKKNLTRSGSYISHNSLLKT